MSSFPAENAISTVATQGSAKTLLEDWLKTTKQLLGGNAISTVVVASDQITPNRGVHRIDTEGSAATDDLKQIVQSNLPDGWLLLISPVSAGRQIKVWHSAGGTGQISLATGGHLWLGDPNHWLLLRRDGSIWTEVLRYPGESKLPILTKTSGYTLNYADRGKQIVALSGSWELDLIGTADVGPGFEFGIHNRGTGIITVDAAGSDFIDENTDIKIHPNEQGWFVSDGGSPSGRWIPTSRTRYRPQRGYLHGLWLSNNATDATNDIDIAVGECASDDLHAESRVTLSTGVTPWTKQLDATWAAGTPAGGRHPSESLANGTWHVYAFRRGSDGLTDFFFSQSTTPTPPDSGTHKRRIGSIVRTSTGPTIRGFIQSGNRFQWKTPSLDVNDAANPGTTAASQSLNVPTGLNVVAFGTVYLEHGVTGTALLLSDLDLPDNAPSTTPSARLGSAMLLVNGGAGAGYSIPFACRTNPSGNIRRRFSYSDASVRWSLITMGWEDARGQETL